MRYVLIALILGTPTFAYADTHADKVQKLFEIQGLESSFQTSIDEGRVRSQDQAKKLLEQMMTELNPAKEFQERMNRAADKFIASMQSDRTAREILDVMAQYYAPQFTEAELNSLIEFYASDVAKKDVEVSRTAMQQVVAHFKEADDKKQQAAVSQFVRDLQMIAAECKCRRKK